MGRAHGRVTGANWVYQGTSTGRAWHLVILADGYTSSEMGKFAADANKFAATLLATKPFNSFPSKINILRLNVESNQSGADKPKACSKVPNVWVDTYFDATFCTLGTERLLTVDTNLVRQTFIDHRIFFHDAIVLVNDPQYGGSGEAQIAVCSDHIDAAQIGIHELGHSAFDLGDEYSSGLGTYTRGEPFAPNMTMATTAATLKWRALVTPGMPIPTVRNPACGQAVVPAVQGQAMAVNAIGSFEGADGYECGIYRPSQVCKMRDRAADFCDVCQQRIAQKLSLI
jgi:hypothetical protein